MSHSPWSRCLILLVILFLLAPPVLAFGGPAPRERHPEPAGALWHLLSGLLSLLETAHGTMDPNGQPSSAPAPPETSSVETDSRGTMDPDGAS